VLTWRFDGGRVVLRPSGTEPKCKAYLELVWPPGVPVAPEEVARQLDALAAEVTLAIALGDR
jgi:phosphomannomutase